VKKKFDFGKLFYGIGNLAYGTVSQTEENFVMFFGTTVLGLSGVLMGIIVAISVFWDAISDPIVGRISDSTNNMVFGKRHGYILFATVGMAVTNLFLWQISPEWSVASKAIVLFLMIMLLETFNTFFASPHGALGVEISTSTHDRTKIMSIKTVFFLFGMLMPSFLLLAFSSSVEGQISSSQLVKMGYATSIICFVFGLVCFFGTLKYIKKNPYVISRKQVAKKSSVLASFFSAFYSREKRAVILGYSTSLLSTAFLSASGLHMFTFSFHFSGAQISSLMLVMFVTAILSQPFWIKQSKLTSKIRAIMSATRIAIIGSLLLALVYVFSRDIGVLTFTFSIVALCVCGFGIGALFSLPISMYSDIIVAERGEQTSCATQLGFLNLANKFSNAFGLLFVGVLLDLVKFNSKMPVQTLEVQNNLAFIVIAGVVASLVVSIWLYRTASPKKSFLAKFFKTFRRGKLNEVQTN